MHVMVKMERDADICSLPLSMLPSSSLQVLSDLMNSTKVLLAEGPTKLPRDWRGLASLAGITSEVAASFPNYIDKTAKVIELWSRNSSITVGHLLDSLKKLDRFDVHDDIYFDLLDHCSKGDFHLGKQIQVQNGKPSISIYDESEIITYDDRPGYKHEYDAFVLYADQDQAFVDELKEHLVAEGLEICTKENLIPGHSTQYAPVSKLISERCLKIILVYSPEFIASSANTFFRDYAQAISIEQRQNKTIPIMYRACTLPPHLALYHMLRYGSAMYNFWDKLTQTLNIARMPRIVLNGIHTTHSAVNIVEMSNTDNMSLSVHGNNRAIAVRSTSEEVLTASGEANGASTSSPEGSVTSDTTPDRKKKRNILGVIYRKVKPKSKKNMVLQCDTTYNAPPHA